LTHSATKIKVSSGFEWTPETFWSKGIHPPHTRFLTENWQKRDYLQAQIVTDQPLSTISTVASLGRAITLPKFGHAFTGIGFLPSIGFNQPVITIAPQYQYRLRPGPGKGIPRLLGQLDWNLDFKSNPQAGLPQVKATLQFTGKVWHLFDDASTSKNHVHSTEGQLIMTLLIPLTSRSTSNAGNFLSLSYTTGANDAKNFLQQANFSIGVKMAR